jgi:hypothetical protein
MKPILLFILLFGFKEFGFAQNEFRMGDDGVYAVINDKDGFTNVHTSPNVNSPITGKIDSYHVFTCEVNKTNWWKVLYIARDNSSKSNWIEGYIYKTKVSLLPEWKPINGKTKQIRVRVNTSSYFSRNHKFLKIDNDTYLIDGKRFWGTDGEIPKICISVVSISINNIPVILPVNAYDDLYEPRLETLSYTYGPGNTIYISMNNSDGAGGYTIIWIIKDNKYYARYIDDSMV